MDALSHALTDDIDMLAVTNISHVMIPVQRWDEDLLDANVRLQPNFRMLLHALTDSGLLRPAGGKNNPF
jgi:hypothetical protein